MSNENNIANSLATAIAAHCAEFEKSPEFAEMVKKHVTSLYEEAIKDTFRWGKFPDSVKKALESALPANISELVDLPRYNTLMAKELAATWEGNAVSERLVTSMREHVLEFVKSHEVPKYIKASDLWDAFVEDHKEEAAQEGWETPSVIMEYSEYGSFTVGLEKAPNKDSYRSKEHAFQLENNLYFSKQRDYSGRERVDILHEGKPVWSLFSGKLEDDVLGKSVVTFRGKFEKLVAALYYGDSLLILDNDDADDVAYPSPY